MAHGYTGALKYLPFGEHVAVVTDARFSGVSTGACLGHVLPEALAGGPIGRLRDGDLIEIAVNRATLEGSVDFVGETSRVTREQAARLLDARPPRPDLSLDSHLPADTRLWAALQDISGGTWGGSVYDVDPVSASSPPVARRRGATRSPARSTRIESPYSCVR